MSMKIEALSTLVLVAHWHYAVVQYCLAYQCTVSTAEFSSDFRPVSTRDAQDALKFWSSLSNISGSGKSRSIFSLQFGNIGFHCCKAFLAVGQKCFF
ncbi:hypothetical protein ACLB2K_063168 [Fragaria x ananassa]